MSTAATAIAWTVEPGRPARTTVPELGLEETCAWLREHQQALRQGLDEHGTVFLRGLPVRSTEDFAQVRNALLQERASYREKATPRSHFGDDVYSSTDLPPQQSIRPHNENSYALEFPGLLLFGCLIAPDEGGATPVTDVRKVLSALPPELAERFRTLGWGLMRTYGDHISLGWRTAFNTDERSVVEKYCQENLLSWEWLPDGGLRTVQRRPATIRHPRTDQEVWFNHMVFWNSWSLDEDTREVLIDDLGADNLPFNTAYGDGSPVPREEVELIDAAYRAATVREQWQPGDVMLVDNLLCAHARDSYRGDRKILVSMGEPVLLADCTPSTPPLAGFAPPPKTSWTSKLRRRRP